MGRPFDFLYGFAASLASRRRFHALSFLQPWSWLLLRSALPRCAGHRPLVTRTPQPGNVQYRFGASAINSPFQKSRCHNRVITLTPVQKIITIRQSGGELIVLVDAAVEFRVFKQTFAAGDWDGVRATLLTEGCVERQITEALATLETGTAASITVTSEPT
jgi:hypothetical protein